MQIKTGRLIILILFLSAYLIRIYNITEKPGALYIDEISIGYNAYSIITTGRDEHGVSWPLFFKAFGEYKLPAYIYLTSLSELILGPNDLAVRLPSVLCGSLTVVFLILFLKELLKPAKTVAQKWLPFIAGFILTVSPWHYQFSRPGFEANLALFFEVLGFWLFFKAKNTKSSKFLILSSISFAMMLYSYSSSRIMVPIIMLGLFLLFIKSFSIKQWVMCTFTTIIFLLPFLSFAVTPEGMSRARETFFWTFDQKQPVMHFINNYSENLNYENLFVRGDGIFNIPFRYGLLHLAELPFLILGLPGIFVFIKSRFKWLLILLLFAGFIPAAITIQNPHSLRNLLVLPFIEITIATGFIWFLSFLRKFPLQVIALTMFITVELVMQSNFIELYFANVNKNSFDWAWQVVPKEAVLKIRQRQNSFDMIYFDKVPTGLHWPTVLWYSKYQPKYFQNLPDKNKVGKYQFNVEDWLSLPKSGKSLYVTTRDISNAKLLDIFINPSSSVVFKIWQI